MPIVTNPIRFGVFEVDLSSGEVRKSGIRIHLADQPFQVLVLLLEHPGQVVTRDELRRRLWSEDTFVDFENGLNAAVKRLREGLGDSADHPRFIETIPRHGYRFIGPPLEGRDVVLAVGRVEGEPASTQRNQHEEDRRRKKWTTSHKVALTIASVGLLALATWAALQISRIEIGEKKAHTIAVLPFKDMSPTKDQAYFADGLADELLTALAKLTELRVSDRNSSFQFRDEKEDLKTIGKKLNVESIVEGSVRKDGQRLHITVQLVNVRDGFQVWAESYDREMNDIFAVQADIATSVGESLKVSLLAAKPTKQLNGAKNVEAYNLYLQGHYFSERRSKQDMEKAISYFDESLRLNPSSAQAWAGLADARMHQADSGYLPVEEGYGKAREAVERALVLDGNLAKAHQCMGWIKMVHDWNWEGARASFERALQLEPGNATTLWEFARLKASMGRFNDAKEMELKAVELDPLGVTAYLNLGNLYYYMGKYDQADHALRKALELNADYPVARAYAVRVYLMQGRAQDAFRTAEQESDPAWRLYSLALANHALGRDAESDAALSLFIQEYHSSFAYQIAEVYAFRGDTELAFEWVERAYQLRDGGLTEMRDDPLMKNIVKDPRHTAFMRKMNLAG